MDCARARELLLEMPDADAMAHDRSGVQAHLSGCLDCQRLHAALMHVDQGLSRHLQPPNLDGGFRARFSARLARDKRRVWADWLPAAVHFASCGVATAVCVAVLPDRAGVITMAAVGITVVSHFLLTTAHSALDAAGD
jgi:predicted anti-sigma-YlaC factor YlaD